MIYFFTIHNKNRYSQSKKELNLYFNYVKNYIFAEINTKKAYAMKFKRFISLLNLENSLLFVALTLFYCSVKMLKFVTSY